ATLTIAVEAVNDAPVANDDSVTTSEDTAITGNVLTAVAEGDVTDTDVDGDTLTVTQFVVNGTTYEAGDTAEIDGVGTLVINEDGSYTFTPADNYSGDVPEVTYTISDGTTTDEATLTIAVEADTPVISSTSSKVYEEALTNGIVDAANGSAAQVADTGTFTITSGNDIDVSDIVLSGPDDVTSGGEAVAWTWDSTTQTLTGTVDDGTTTVMTISVDSFTDNVDGTYTVAYTTKLLSAIDHSNTTSEDTASLAFTVSVSDDTSGTTGTGTLTVDVVDDAPVAVNSVATASVNNETAANLMIVLDISGSMNTAAGDGTRLSAAKEAITALIEAYDEAGEVMVNIVLFGTTASNLTSGWITAEEALTLIDDIATSGSTNYDAALAEAMDAWTESGALEGDDVQNVLYFLSDGEPTRGDGNTSQLSNASVNGTTDAGISTAEEAIWHAFLEQYGITAYGLGISSDATAEYIEPIAYDGVAQTDTEVIIVEDVDDLSDVLTGLVVSSGVTSNLVNGDLAEETGFGADGGTVSVLAMDDITYAYDSSASTLTVTDASGNTVESGSGYTYDSTEHVLTITDEHDGTLVVDLDTGDYTYTPSSDIEEGYTETVSVTLADADGDSATGLLTLYVSTSGDDSFTWDGTAGTLDGDDGSDTVALSGVASISGEDLAATLTNIEVLDLTSDAVSITSLTAADVFDITGSSEDTSITLTIDGTDDDSVQLGGSADDWTVTDSGAYLLYTYTADGTAVKIDDDITVSYATLAPV
ncbi:MAG: Ig-like domain-containing protein, partial [Acidovorax sp.]|uniref:Ig-like domain-containing protein n=1 Tax=Acidovorax sp. TaxID=1872122 RepID=UPI0039E5C98A